MLPSGKRIPGLKLDHPRQLALMHALICFAHIAAGTFTTAELYRYVLAALEMSADQYSLASLRYDLRKLRAKDLVEKLPKSRRYRLRPQGYSICLVFLTHLSLLAGSATQEGAAGLHRDQKVCTTDTIF